MWWQGRPQSHSAQLKVISLWWMSHYLVPQQQKRFMWSCLYECWWDQSRAFLRPDSRSVYSSMEQKQSSGLSTEAGVSSVHCLQFDDHISGSELSVSRLCCCRRSVGTITLFLRSGNWTVLIHWLNKDSLLWSWSLLKTNLCVRVLWWFGCGSTVAGQPAYIL